MGLFYKHELPQSSTLYSSGLEKTKLIVGLGNVGRDYELTRHNAGFIAVEAYAKAKSGSWVVKKAHKSLVCDLREGQNRIIICKPTTLMNLSGEAVHALQRFYKITNDDTLVIHDELDIDFGTLRIRQGGGSAGHNGIKSLIQHIGEDFTHVRIGIGPKTHEKMDSSDFVLQQFALTEQAELKTMSNEVSGIITEFIYSGSLPAETRKFIF